MLNTDCVCSPSQWSQWNSDIVHQRSRHDHSNHVDSCCLRDLYLRNITKSLNVNVATSETQVQAIKQNWHTCTWLNTSRITNSKINHYFSPYSLQQPHNTSCHDWWPRVHCRHTTCMEQSAWLALSNFMNFRNISPFQNFTLQHDLFDVKHFWGVLLCLQLDTSCQVYTLLETTEKFAALNQTATRDKLFSHRKWRLETVTHYKWHRMTFEYLECSQWSSIVVSMGRRCIARYTRLRHRETEWTLNWRRTPTQQHIHSEGCFSFCAACKLFHLLCYLTAVMWQCFMAMGLTNLTWALTAIHYSNRIPNCKLKTKAWNKIAHSLSEEDCAPFLQPTAILQLQSITIFVFRLVHVLKYNNSLLQLC